MKVSFDAQFLLEAQKTGIGRMTEALIEEFQKDPEVNTTLHFFNFLNSKAKKSKIDKYIAEGYQVKVCCWFHRGIYLRIWKYIPIPYNWFFNEQCNISQFFCSDIPPKANGKKIVFVHDMAYKSCPDTMDKKVLKIIDRNMEKTCQRADCIVTVSEFSKQEIIKYMGIDKNKIHVMPSGVDLDRYTPNYSEKDVLTVNKKYGINEEYILYLGTLEPRKNIGTLIDAYYLLIKNNDRIPMLVIAGRKGWLYDEIYEKIKLYKLEDKVKFTGYITKEEAPIMLKGAMLFVFPSTYEGFGLPPLEAMACGTPVIISDAASLPEVVSDAGIKVSPHDSEELAKAMKQLIDAPELRDYYSKKGLRRAANFSWQNSKSILKNIYRDMVNSGD
ncbi:glycosyltransferase family 4 protein [Anaerocolumna jejuensis]|uniref:glycosyltransferase family 4 protein n=1 Tax=Anaerocolumna jejuensis TaxID=259063 RepID=UPI003F7BE3C1